MYQAPETINLSEQSVLMSDGQNAHLVYKVTERKLCSIQPWGTHVCTRSSETVGSSAHILGCL